jgi:hypothetical protein
LPASTGACVGLVQFSTPPGSTSDALGLFLVFSALAMTCTGLTASLSKIGIATVFLTAALRFLLGGIHQLTAEGTAKRAGSQSSFPAIDARH